MINDEEKKVSISEDDIKTITDLKNWISRNSKIEKIEDGIMANVINELCRQVKETNLPGSGSFCFKLIKLKGRLNVSR